MSVAVLLRLADLVEAWVSRVPKEMRKTVSHSGAIRSRRQAPTHYVCPDTGERYFDPCNYIYALAFNMLFPQLVEMYNWNQETKGDIFESLLGLAYCKRFSRYAADKAWMLQSEELSRWLDAVIFDVWEFSQGVSCDDLESQLRFFFSTLHRKEDRAEDWESSSSNEGTEFLGATPSEREHRDNPPRWKRGKLMLVSGLGYIPPPHSLDY